MISFQRPRSGDEGVIGAIPPTGIMVYHCDR